MLPPWGAGEGSLHNKSLIEKVVLSFERVMLKKEEMEVTSVSRE